MLTIATIFLILSISLSFFWDKASLVCLSIGVVMFMIDGICKLWEE